VRQIRGCGYQYPHALLFLSGSISLRCYPAFLVAASFSLGSDIRITSATFGSTDSSDFPGRLPCVLPYALLLVSPRVSYHALRRLLLAEDRPPLGSSRHSRKPAIALLAIAPRWMAIPGSLAIENTFICSSRRRLFAAAEWLVALVCYGGVRTNFACRFRASVLVDWDSADVLLPSRMDH